MTKEEFIIEMDWFTAYYGYQMNQIMASIWFEAFEKFKKENFKIALLNHIKKDENPFFPALGKIYALIKNNHENILSGVYRE